jgi:hypothetical protein
MAFCWGNLFIFQNLLVIIKLINNKFIFFSLVKHSEITKLYLKAKYKLTSWDFFVFF